MGLEEVVKDILDKAKADSLVVAKAGNEKAAEIIKKAETEILIKEQRARDDLQRVKESEERKELSDAALAAKKKFQNVKKELIESAYSGLMEKAADIPERERAKMLKTLFAKCAREISGIGKVYVNKKDVKLVGEIVRSAKISVLSENIIGGIIAESSDGKFRVDCSFDRFIELVKETRTKELSNTLF